MNKIGKLDFYSNRVIWIILNERVSYIGKIISKGIQFGRVNQVTVYVLQISLIIVERGFWPNFKERIQRADSI